MRFLGHPLHPMLVHFPIAFWVLASLCDVISITGLGRSYGLGDLGAMSGLFLLLGLVFAIMAMMAGLMDLGDVPERAQGDANLHLLCMGGAWLAYLSALITRLDGAAWPLPLPGGLSVALSLVGLFLLGIGGWYGGQLVYKHGAGVDFSHQQK